MSSPADIGGKVGIIHDPENCRCRIVDGAIYVAEPCQVFGRRLSKKILAQLKHRLTRSKK